MPAQGQALGSWSFPCPQPGARVPSACSLETGPLRGPRSQPSLLRELGVCVRLAVSPWPPAFVPGLKTGEQGQVHVLFGRCGRSIVWPRPSASSNWNLIGITILIGKHCFPLTRKESTEKQEVEFWSWNHERGSQRALNSHMCTEHRYGPEAGAVPPSAAGLTDSQPRCTALGGPGATSTTRGTTSSGSRRPNRHGESSVAGEPFGASRFPARRCPTDYGAIVCPTLVMGTRGWGISLAQMDADSPIRLELGVDAGIKWKTRL